MTSRRTGRMLIAAMATSMVLSSPDFVATQQPSRMEMLVSILRPVLPYPDADVNGDLPAGGGAQAKWFVIWPAENEPRIIVRANPLHPETQAAGAKAMNEIQSAVVAAERKAQAAYDRALEELRRTGKAADLEGISLDDEGVAGERIDAELELTIDLDPAPATFELDTSKEPVIIKRASGPSFVMQVPPNTYREKTASGTRQRFRPAEARLYFDMKETAVVTRRHSDRFAITLPSTAAAFAVILRGNETLLNELVARADWARLQP